MTWKSYAVVSGVGVVAMLMQALPASMPDGVQPAQPSVATSAPVTSSDIEEQAGRLQARLQQEALYRQPSRNPFRFGARPAASPATAPRVDAPPAAPERSAGPPPLPITLAGVAIDQDVHTAIFSTPSGVVLATAGDEVLGYRVSAVGDESADLVRIEDGGAVRLTLK